MFWRGRSRHQARTATPWRQRAATLAALLAVFLQAFVVQTHVHTPSAPLQLSYAQPAGATDDAASRAKATNSHHPILCVICQTLASSGSATLPSAAIIAATAQTNGEATLALALAPRAQSHSWRSRAPPSFL